MNRAPGANYDISVPSVLGEDHTNISAVNLQYSSGLSAGKLERFRSLFTVRGFSTMISLAKAIYVAVRHAESYSLPSLLALITATR